MYLEYLYCQNFGPISCAAIKMPFTDQGKPKPIVLVGKNGSGKTILLSSIVDSFYEFAADAFEDVASKSGVGHHYFRTAAGSQVKIGARGGVTCLWYKTDEESFKPQYFYREGIVSGEQFIKVQGSLGIPNPKILLAGSDRKKECTKDSDKFRKIFEGCSICYFPASRYAVPDWLGTAYSRQDESLYLAEKFTSKLDKPICVECTKHKTIDWLVDVLVDAKSSLRLENGRLIAADNINDKMLLERSKENIERILSEIMECPIELSLKYRGSGLERVSMGKRNHPIPPIVPSLRALSTGQALLLDMFATIIRYSDRNDINKSIKLEDIKGIVVIDEIDAHLHADLQRKVVPRLVKLFPGVQFIITSHAPLFLLGMQEQFGDVGFEIYEMPDCQKISAEDFAEFRTAYSYYENTKLAQDYVKAAIERQVRTLDRALIVTEGPTDWMHLKHAWGVLQADYPVLKDKFSFYEFQTTGDKKKDMGDGEICKLCANFSKIPHRQKLIFVSDRDQEDVAKKMNGGGEFKSWGNNIYSFALPVPSFRSSAPGVSIEHYYPDKLMKAEVDVNGHKARLFTEDEFNENNVCSSDRRFFAPNLHKSRNPNSVLDGSAPHKVIDSGTDNNVALSKIAFANAVIEGKIKLDDEALGAFRLFFDVLSKVVSKQDV